MNVNEYLRMSTIYQIFPRNYSKDGTFKKITEDLDRIESLGVNILYLLPINKIGEKVEIIVDFYDQYEGYYVCRTMGDSPDVDFYILIDYSPNIKVGEFYTAKIKDYFYGFFKGEII